MSELQERVAYLHGLANGFKLEESGREGQVLVEMINVLDLMAANIARVEIAQEEMEGYVESIDADLGDLEEEVLEEDETVWEFTCPNCGVSIEVAEEDYDNDGVVEFSCPECGRLVEDRFQSRDGRAGAVEAEDERIDGREGRAGQVEREGRGERNGRNGRIGVTSAAENGVAPGAHGAPPRRQGEPARGRSRGAVRNEVD